MTVWLVKDGEQIPFSAEQRHLRMGLLASALRRRGHEVVWWSSSFDHANKSPYRDWKPISQTHHGVIVRMFDCGTYQKNVSLQRIQHHRTLASNLARAWEAEPVPDLLVCALPIVDLVHQTRLFAAPRSIPYIIDVRDLWPDVFWCKAPAPLRPIVKALSLRAIQRVRGALRAASSRVAVSAGYLKWALRHSGINEPGPWDRVLPLGHPGFKGTASTFPARLVGKLDGRFVATFVGTFGHSYDLELLCQAAQKYHDSGAEVSFVLAGKGEKGESLEKQYKHLPNLHFPGWLNSGEIHGVLKASHVGLAPCLSVPDTVPNKPFEYFAAGLPVLSSLVGEMERILEADGSGLSYRAKDLPGFLECLDKIRTDPALRERMATAALSVFQARYHENAIYQDYAGLAEEVACSSNPRLRNTAGCAG